LASRSSFSAHHTNGRAADHGGPSVLSDEPAAFTPRPPAFVNEKTGGESASSVRGHKTTREQVPRPHAQNGRPGNIPRHPRLSSERHFAVSASRRRARECRSPSPACAGYARPRRCWPRESAETDCSRE